MFPRVALDAAFPHGAGEVVQVTVFGLVQAKGPGDRVQYLR
jgi:hypothetical protein